MYQFNQHAHYALEVTTNVVKAVNLKHHRVHLMDFIVTMTSTESIKICSLRSFLSNWRRFTIADNHMKSICTVYDQSTMTTRPASCTRSTTSFIHCVLFSYSWSNSKYPLSVQLHSISGGWSSSFFCRVHLSHGLRNWSTILIFHRALHSTIQLWRRCSRLATAI